jgi:hypothetical protein
MYDDVQSSFNLAGLRKPMNIKCKLGIVELWVMNSALLFEAQVLVNVKLHMCIMSD